TCSSPVKRFLGMVSRRVNANDESSPGPSLCPGLRRFVEKGSAALRYRCRSVVLRLWTSSSSFRIGVACVAQGRLRMSGRPGAQDRIYATWGDIAASHNREPRRDPDMAEAECLSQSLNPVIAW